MEEIVNNQIDELYHNNYIRDRNNSKECHKKYVMEDKIYFDSIKLLGLKKFLNEFSPDDKEIKDVHMWNNYLIYAYLFGMEKIIQKKFKTSRIDNISYKLAFSSDLLYVTDKLFFALMDIVVILSRPIGIISYRSFDNQ